MLMLNAVLGRLAAVAPWRAICQRDTSRHLQLAPRLRAAAEANLRFSALPCPPCPSMWNSVVTLFVTMTGAGWADAMYHATGTSQVYQQPQQATSVRRRAAWAWQLRRGAPDAW